MWLELIALVVVLVYLFKKFYIDGNDDYWPKRGIPYVKRSEVATLYQLFTGKATLIGMDNGYYNNLKDKKFGGTMEVWKPVFHVTDLDIIKQILVKDFDHFTDRRDASYMSEPMFENMLTGLQGQQWKNVRNVLTPTFTTGKIRRMFENFNTCGKNLVECIKNRPKATDGQGHKIIIQDVVSRFTVDVIGATAFGMDTNSLQEKDSIFYKMSKRLSDLTTKRVIMTFFVIFLPKLFNFLRLKLIEEDIMKFYKDILSQALKNREASKEKRDDFLQLMVESRKGDLKLDETELEAFEKDAQLKSESETNSDLAAKEKKTKFYLSDDLAMAQSLLFFIAGFDTTGALLNFTAYLLAIHQEIQDRLFLEVKEAMESSDGKIDYDSIARMEFLDMFISEILRLYPPAGRLERKCISEYKIPGTDVTIEKDILVAIPVQGIHLDEKYYPDPKKFDPERFTMENKAQRHPYAYMPFGVGPRNCIGMRFALMESKVAIAYMVHNFIIEPTAKTPIPIKLDPKLGANRVVPDLELRFTPRN